MRDVEYRGVVLKSRKGEYSDIIAGIGAVDKLAKVIHLNEIKSIMVQSSCAYYWFRFNTDDGERVEDLVGDGFSLMLEWGGLEASTLNGDIVINYDPHWKEHECIGAIRHASENTTH